ncbi:NaCP60E [Symbiodinium natans]|uniref:NaCP60E protein n=1 Tax=Symbiodinium natans TaxID=878477 RepID=A0A812S656_9DINO|nr:NaCP60E [Symbiodinium natans]
MAGEGELGALPQLVKEVLQQHRDEQQRQLDQWLHSLDGLLRQGLHSTLRGSTSSEALHFDSYAPVLSTSLHMSAINTTRSDMMRIEEEWQASWPSNTPHKLVERTESYELARQESTRIHRKEIASGVISQDEDKEGKLGRLRALAHLVANSVAFELLFAVVILTNAVYLGIQLQWDKESRTAAIGGDSLTVQLIFAVLFSIEVGIRLVAVGCRSYVCGRDRLWNWLDIFVVSTSWFVIGVELLATAGLDEANNSQLRIFRVFRVGRLLRVVGSLWVVRSIKALRQLVNSLVDTLKSLFWALVLLCLIIYTFAILFTDAAIDYAFFNDPPPTLESHFGTLSRSVNTLLRAILGGEDWWIAADALQKIGTLWEWIFNFYVCFCTFAVLNVMTGVFCNSAIKAAERDHDTLMQNRHEFRQLAHDLFSKMDSSGLGRITISEFERLFDDEAMKAFLETAEINAVDAWTLFASLDVDGDYVISVDEFTERCMQLHGPARAVDVFGLQRHQMKYREQVYEVEQRLAQLEPKINMILGACQSLAASHSDDFTL